MNKALDSAVEKAKKDTATPMASAVLTDGSLIEMVCRPEENRTLLCIFTEGQVRYETSLLVNNIRFAPYSPRNNLLLNEVVLLPSEATDYESEQALVEEIRAFIHKYVDVSPLFEQIASYYVLFSWVHDAFNELPYLRIRGDTGSGKTRCLLTVGSLCYKPIFASGASTVSPLFRILDAFRGTMIIDECDFRFSDEKAEIVKILNNGNARGFPVLRSESVGGKEYSPRAYTVFGPKLVATRGYFEDRALESRCLTEEVGGRRLREDIPLNLTSAYKQEARDLRNKLLMFRFRNFGRCQVDPSLVDRSIEPRLSQIFVPLLSVIGDSQARETLRQVAREYHRELVADRGMDVEAKVLEILRELRDSPYDGALSIKEIRDRFAARYEEDFERKITPHWIGFIIRRKLQLRTERRHGNYVIAPTEGDKLVRLFEKYGIDTPTVDLGDSGDSTPELEKIAAA
ncbi:MAG: hypothetical protein HY650_10845 [Acidobacteria bacterium]|nr:hypothetical protein [Acidobacteriota bacterium]